MKKGTAWEREIRSLSRSRSPSHCTGGLIMKLVTHFKHRLVQNMSTPFLDTNDNFEPTYHDDLHSGSSSPKASKLSELRVHPFSPTVAQRALSRPNHPTVSFWKHLSCGEFHMDLSIGRHSIAANKVVIRDLVCV